MPLAPLLLGKKVIVLRGHEPEASDHDWHRFKLCPSVLCNVNIPENINDSFYDSTVTVTLKDSVFEKSTPLRHQAEKENSVAIWIPIECSFSDGGSDHNPRNYSVKIGHFAHFLKVDLDMSVSVVTYPGGSYTNPAERAMSLLNIAMQGVALSRVEIVPEYVEKCELYGADTGSVRWR